MIDNKSINIIKNCAIKYKKHFSGNSVLFILVDKNKNISFFEAYFYESSFLHLTGIEIDNEKYNEDEYISASEFLELSVNGKIEPKRYNYKTDGTTQLKLKVLPSLLNENMSVKMVGDYNDYAKYLTTEKLAGNIFAAMGFIKDNKGKYVPNTVLSGDIRDRTNNPLRVIAMYKKPFRDDKYITQIYLSKGVELSYYRFPEKYEYLKSIKNKA